MLTFSLAISYVVVIILLIASGLVSASEVAFFSLKPADKEALDKENNSKSKKVLQLIATPNYLLSNILIANNLINIAIVLISSYIMTNQFLIKNALAEIIIQVGVVTFLLLLFGEVIPKVYATTNRISLAKTMAFPIHFIGLIVKPLSYTLVKSTSIIDKRIRKRVKNISVNDLEYALELTQDSTSKEEKKILDGIVKFGNTDVKQIMSPRVDMVAINTEQSYEEIRTEILEAGYSRIPVYSDSIDKIEGILYVKDLLPYIDKKDFDWTELLRTPIFVPENKKIDDLFSDFQTVKTHMAIVVDEYGGTLGVVTLEDVMEEIIGEITDEFDDDEINYSKIDDNNYIFEGKTSLIDLYKVLKIEGDEFEEKKGEADTVAGFLIELSGKILRKNEKVTFNNYQFVIEAADNRRVKQVKVCILPKKETQDL